MLYDTISSDNQEKDEDNSSGNYPINIQILTTNIKKFQCAENLQRISLYRWKYNSKETRKIHFLCPGLTWAIFGGSTEGNNGTSPWLQWAKIQMSDNFSWKLF